MIYTTSIKQIHIITTTRCNLNCSYCYENRKSGVDMDVDKVFEALKAEFLSTPVQIPILLSMHGGEPLLAHEKIKVLADKIWSHFSDRKVIINIITNGTILNDDIKSWIINNKDNLSIAISLDGLPMIHDRNRCNSYSKIDIGFFRSLGRHVYAKMTVAPDSIPSLTDGFIHLYNIGIMPHVSMAAECEYSDEQIRALLIELSKLVTFYQTHNNIPVTELLDIPFERMSAIASQNPSAHRCGIGCYRTAFDINGNRYPCQTFISDFQKEYNKEVYDSITHIINTEDWRTISPKCQGCVIANICSPCYGLNYCNRANMGALDTNLCRINKIRVIAAAKLWAELITKRDCYSWMSTISDNELALKVDGIAQFYKIKKKWDE